jgi:hypothetical protein
MITSVTASSDRKPGSKVKCGCGVSRAGRACSEPEGGRAGGREAREDYSARIRRKSTVPVGPAGFSHQTVLAVLTETAQQHDRPCRRE